MKEKPKYWRVFSRILLFALLLQPGFFAHAQSGNARNIRVNAKPASQQSVPTTTSPIVLSGKVNIQAQPTGFIQTAVGFVNLQGSSQARILFSPGFNTTEFSLNITPVQTQKVLAVRDVNPTANIAAQPQRNLAQRQNYSGSNQQQSLAIISTTQNFAQLLKINIQTSSNFARSTAHRLAGQGNGMLELSQLSIWRC